MPVVDFRAEPPGGRGITWAVPGSGFVVRGVPDIQITNTSPSGPNGVTAYSELLIDLPNLAMMVALDLVIGNVVEVQALDSAGYVIDRRTFAAGTGPAAAILTAPDDVIQRIRMADSGTEDRITIVIST